jgi:hypothetical protein
MLVRLAMAERSTKRGGQPVYEVEFAGQSSAYPFIRASEKERCTFELAKMMPRPNGRYAEFFNVTGVADPARIESLAGDHHSVDARLLREYDQGGLFEFLVSGDCPAFELAELGALPRSVRSTDGEGHIVAEIPEHYDPGTVIETFLDDNPDFALACKQKKADMAPLVTKSAVCQVMERKLTERQREVLQTAYEAGYYEWPRKCTGEDVAAMLDITSATFSEHIHAAERKLVSALFEQA